MQAPHFNYRLQPDHTFLMYSSTIFRTMWSLSFVSRLPASEYRWALRWLHYVSWQVYSIRVPVQIQSKIISYHLLEEECHTDKIPTIASAREFVNINVIWTLLIPLHTYTYPPGSRSLKILLLSYSQNIVYRPLHMCDLPSEKRTVDW